MKINKQQVKVFIMWMFFVGMLNLATTGKIHIALTVAVAIGLISLLGIYIGEKL